MRAVRHNTPHHWFITFEVTGRGEFPVDMLRYDGCWPVDGVDASNILGGQDAPLRTVKLMSMRDRKDWQPTVARWQSFLWGCE